MVSPSRPWQVPNVKLPDFKLPDFKANQMLQAPNYEHFFNIRILQSYKIQQVAMTRAYTFEFAWISDSFEFAGAWHQGARYQSPRDQSPRCEGSGHQGASI